MDQPVSLDKSCFDALSGLLRQVNICNGTWQIDTDLAETVLAQAAEADQKEQQYPRPISFSERNPKWDGKEINLDDDCCWCYSPRTCVKEPNHDNSEGYYEPACWSYTKPDLGYHTHWLPASTRFLPARVEP